MKKIAILILLLSLCCARSFAQDFSGKIIYTNTFKDLQGKDITARMAPFFGKETHYFIKDSNYKAYDQDQRLLYLYNASANTYYSAQPGNEELGKQDAGKKSEEKYHVKKIAGTAKICGYDCISLEEKTPTVTTIYFFNAAIRVNKNAFQQHHFGNWNAYLEATDGSLPLKMVCTDTKNGFVWTSTARAVERLQLTRSDFDIEREKKQKDKSAGSTPQADWLIYPGKGWSIYFPGKPEESQQNVSTAIGDQAMHIYMYTAPSPANEDNFVYGVIQSIFPDSLVNSAKTEMIEPLMRNSIDGAVKNVKGELLSESVIDLDGFPGRAVKVSFQQGAGFINLRIYLVRNTLYILQAICDKSKDNNASTKRFLDSFQLKD